MADSDTTQQVTSQTPDTTQQVTSQTPDTTQQVTSQTPAKKQKNPNRVAAGKKIAEKTRLAREAQKKALIRAQAIIAKNEPTVETPAVETPAVETPAVETPAVETPAKNVLTATQWLSIISIVVSLAGLYYKREEIKGLLAPKKPQVSPTVTPVVPKKGIRLMD